MDKQKSTLDEGRLERSCGGSHSDAVRSCGLTAGVERLEAAFGGVAFSPHRHDVYAVCRTLSGVQTFRYRGRRHISLPGDLVILHPDELHDGRAGSDDGFSYRMIYLDPAAVADATGGSLPYVSDPVVSSRSVPGEVGSLFDEFCDPLDRFHAHEVMAKLAGYLGRLSADRMPKTGKANERALRRIAEILDSDFDAVVGLEDLEEASGLGRWQITRQFHALFGTSPYRYRVLRRVNEARRLLEDGTPIAEAAAASGFSDQSHLTRQFRNTFGMTPGRWLSLGAQTSARALDHAG